MATVVWAAFVMSSAVATIVSSAVTGTGSMAAGIERDIRHDRSIHPCCIQMRNSVGWVEVFIFMA